MSTIKYNTQYLGECSSLLGGVVQGDYKTLEAIIHTFFDQDNINSALFPYIVEGTKQTYCSFFEPHSTSRPIINGKSPVLLSNKDIVKYTNKFQYLSKVKFKKHIICFTIFLFSALMVKIDDQASKNLYDYMTENSAYENYIFSFMTKIRDYLEKYQSGAHSPISIKYEFCEFIKNTISSDKIPDDIATKLEELVELIKADKFYEIKISDLFKLKSTETGQEYKGLLDHLKTEVKKEAQAPEEKPFTKINEKLFEYIKNLRIPSCINDEGKSTLYKSVYDQFLSLFETIKCTNVKEDLFTLIEFTDFTLDQLNTFINYRSTGYCYTYDYIALKMINERSNPKLDIEIPFQTLAGVLAKYYVYSANNESLEGFLRAYDEMRNNYIDKDNNLIFGKLIELNKETIKTLRDKLSADEFKEIPDEFKNFTGVFEFILNPGENGLSKKIENKAIEELCKKSIGTIFDLIGLFGYTLFSDDISVFDNDDGSKFSISKNCSLILLDLFEKLEINIKDIKFSYKNLSGANTETSIGIILEKMHNTCIHGVGNEAMRYFFLALKVKKRYIDQLKAKISPQVELTEEQKQIELTPDQIEALEELKLYGYQGTLETEEEQATAKEFVNDTFRDPPFIIKVLKQIQNTDFAYLTCIRQDKIHNFNPLACIYNVIGYTIDGDVSYLCLISSARTYVKDLNPNSALDFLNKSENFTVITHNMCKNRATGDIFTNFLKSHTNYLRRLISISYAFQKNRVPLFKVYKEYTLNICTIMSNKIKAQTRDKFLTKLYKKTQYDVINMEETGFPVKYLTGIVIEDNNYRGHLYGNTTLTDEKINANTAKTNAQSIQNNSKYYVTTLDNIANLRYVPDDKEKAIIKLPETGQDITRPFHYAKLLASMLYPDMYFQECTVKISSKYKTYSEHVQRKWSLFESYYHNVNGQSSQFRQLMFSSLSFKYIVGAYNKTKTKGQFSRMKFIIGDQSGVEELVNAMIEGDSEKNKLNEKIINQPQPAETPNLKAKLISDLEAMFDYFETIDAINAPIILGKILYKFNEIKGYIGKPQVYPELIQYLEDTIISIIERMRFWMAHTINYFKNILPSNGYYDKVNANRWKVEERFRDFEIEWNEINPEELVKNEQFNFIGRKYYLVLEGVIDAIIQHGYDPSTYQYHFTEIQKELYLIKYLANLDALKSDPKNNTNVGFLDLEQEPNFVKIFRNSQEVIEKIIPFYNDKMYYTDFDDDDASKKEIFKREDYQECIRTRFEYLLKIELVKMHETRMQQYAYFENLLANIFKNYDADPIIRIVIKTQTLFKNYTSSHPIRMLEIFDSIQDYNPVPSNPAPVAQVPVAPPPDDAQAQGLVMLDAQAQGLVMLDVQDREIAEALIEIIDNILAENNQIGLLLMKAEIQEMIDTNVYDRPKLQNFKTRFEMMMNLDDDEE